MSRHKLRRGRRVIVRLKRNFPTVRSAMKNLEETLGIYPHQLTNPDHHGGYWRWEVQR